MPERPSVLLLLVAMFLIGGCASSGRDDPFNRASNEEASAANARLGASYLQAGNLQEANERLKRALELDPENADAHAAYAILQMRLEEPEKAEHHFERALDIDPDSPRLKNNFATMLCDRGEYDRAIDLFLQAADDRLYETPAFAYDNAGTCALDAGRDEEAREYLVQARKSDPGFQRPVIKLAELAFEDGDADEAAGYLETYHDLGRASARSLWLGVRIERRRGNPDEAERYGKRLVRNFPDSEEADAFFESRK